MILRELDHDTKQKFKNYELIRVTSWTNYLGFPAKFILFSTSDEGSHSRLFLNIYKNKSLYKIAIFFASKQRQDRLQSELEGSTP